MTIKPATRLTEDGYPLCDEHALIHAQAYSTSVADITAPLPTNWGGERECSFCQDDPANAEPNELTNEQLAEKLEAFAQDRHDAYDEGPEGPLAAEAARRLRGGAEQWQG